MADDKGISEVLKKVISVGVGAAFMTEDTIKTVLKDLPLPREILNGLVNNAKGAKEEFVESVQIEVREALSKVDPSKLMEEVLDNYDIEVSAKFSFTKKEKVEVKTKTKSKVQKKTKDA